MSSMIRSGDAEGTDARSGDLSGVVPPQPPPENPDVVVAGSAYDNADDECTAWRTCPPGHGPPAGVAVGADVGASAIAPHALQRHSFPLLQATALSAVLKYRLPDR